MNAAARHHLSAWRRTLRASVPLLGLGVVAGALVDCSVSTIPDASRPFVANTCTDSKDCGSNGVCTNGACYSRSGSIDEVLLEIIPDANSAFANISFLSMQDGLRRGAPSRSIALPAPVTFQAQVQVNGEDLDKDCPYLHSGKQSVAARIQYVRTGTVGGVPVSGLSRPLEPVDTEPSGSGFSKSVALVPGVYDIYAKPTSWPDCQIAPKIWRSVEVGRDGQVVPWAPPATLELPRPVELTGSVTRVGGDLADWQVELIDPQDGRVISTSARLGFTTDTAPATNFAVTFQPLEISSVGPDGVRPPTAPVIQLRPPKRAESTAPVVYFDLAGMGGAGPLDLDISKLPNERAVVTVAGQVRDSIGEAVRATVRFVNTSFQMQGLLASFGPASASDGSGHYTARLFPGDYRIVIVPEGATDNASAMPDTPPNRLSAITEVRQKIGTESMQAVDLTAAPTRIIEGVATAGISSGPAQGANLEAYPVLGKSSGVLNGVLSQATTPPAASVAVDDSNGHFRLVLDPGFYDFAVKPDARSNFAWWLYPNVHVLPMPPIPGGTLDPQLAYPVPLGGTITVMTADRTSQPLRNATLKAYARTSEGGVIQVGTARTDDMGRYDLPLPPGFYTP